nr:hypothetical protein [Tanacetum cinerariifolium]
MASLVDKAILSGADNRPPMLEKDMYDSWKSRMELYMLNRPHGRMILESVEQGPLIWPSVEVEGVTRLKKYSELSAAEAIQADCDVDVVPLVPKLRKNRTAHIDYIKHTLEEADTLKELVESKRLLSLLNTSLAYASHIDYIKHTLEEAATLKELVESERLLSPLNTSLVYACKYTRRIQELLMILQQTCPRTTDLGTNLVAVTPKNQTKQVRPLVSSASGSQSKDNTKKYRIRRTHKKAKETDLEDHLRNIKSSLNKASVVDSRATSSVIKSVSNVNSNLKCASCNGCLFFDNHDACVVEYINSVNASRKSKSVKQPVKRKVWKSTGKVFKTVGHIWKPTGQTFKLVGNVCPLTRIATATIVPPREPIPIV